MKPAESSAAIASGNATEERTEEVDSKTPRRQRIDKPPRDGWFTRLIHRLERKVSRLSVKNNFWHRVCSWIWLPLAFRSGITIAKPEQEGDATFTAFLPFRRFNRNWYNAMAGAALLANSEVAGGMYVFKRCGGDYTVVCKELTYKFLRPCVGPALYRVEPHEDVDAKVKAGGEFNITVDMHIVQMVTAGDDKERRVGTCTATFHVTPKSQVRARIQRRLERERQRQANEDSTASG
jgi:acyl-coenzyme A thioesterase PaaI-like protein